MKRSPKKNEKVAIVVAAGVVGSSSPAAGGDGDDPDQVEEIKNRSPKILSAGPSFLLPL
jgi:hypothetical protein